jgi:hypothetical protein
VPSDVGQTVHLVIDDFCEAGCLFREVDLGQADLETVLMDLLQGQHKNPVRIVAFNTEENW